MEAVGRQAGGNVRLFRESAAAAAAAKLFVVCPDANVFMVFPVGPRVGGRVVLGKTA